MYCYFAQSINFYEQNFIFTLIDRKGDSLLNMKKFLRNTFNEIWLPLNTYTILIWTIAGTHEINSAPSMVLYLVLTTSSSFVINSLMAEGSNVSPISPSVSTFTYINYNDYEVNEKFNKHAFASDNGPFI